MPRIAIIPLAETSHYLPALEVAQGLRSAGHAIVFIGTLDFQKLVTDRGFEFIPAFPELFPEGTLHRQLSKEGPRLRSLLARPRRAVFIWRASRARARLQRELLHREQHGELSGALVKAAAPDLFLVDSFLALVSVALTRYQKPILQFNVTLAAGESKTLPPSTYFAQPTTSSFRNALLWGRVRWQRFVAQRLSALLGLDYQREVTALANATAFPLSELEERSEFALRIALPELVLCHRAFDFPHPESPKRFYVGPCTSRGSAEPVVHLPASLTERPLVYCAFGSQSSRFPFASAVLNLIWESFQTQNELSLIVVVNDPSSFLRGAAHTMAIGSCNQPALLPNVALMITHGGLGSIKECILHRVPMLAVPLGRDQPGNAARICYHNLGTMLSTKQLSRERLLATIRRTIADSTIKESLAQQQQALLATEAELGAVKVIAAAFAAD